MKRSLHSLNVDSTGADYTEAVAAAKLVFFPDGVDSSSIMGIDDKNMPTTPQFTGKFDPTRTPNSQGTVYKNGVKYSGAINTRNYDVVDTTVSNSLNFVSVKTPDCVSYDQCFVPANAKVDANTASIYYRAGADSRGSPNIHWRPAVRVYTSNKKVTRLEVFAKIFNNTGEILSVKNLSVTLTGNSTSSQNEVNERATFRPASASAACAMKSAAVDDIDSDIQMSAVGETQKFTIPGDHEIGCGEKVFRLFEITAENMKSQRFYYFYNPMTNTTQYGYQMVFNRFVPAASVSVLDYTNGIITNLGSRACGSATPDSSYLVIVGNSVQYSPKAVASIPKFEPDNENSGYYRKSVTYQISDINRDLVLRVPKHAVDTVPANWKFDTDSNHYVCYLEELGNISELVFTLVSHGYGKKF